MSDRIYAISPLDGRYAALTEPLVPYASEAALMRARLEVEIEYLIALSTLEALPLDLSSADVENLRELYIAFDETDATLIKRIEEEGTDSYPATNHDVKAVEYFVRERLPDHLDIDHWIHFGLTSEDVNNLAWRILLSGAIDEVLRPALVTIRTDLADEAAAYRELPMLARTHGQPATPTTYGKELAVYASRLDRAIDRVDEARNGLSGKLAGASGTYAAHTVAFPEIEWDAVARTFVSSLGFEHLALATQVNPSDDLAALFDAIRGVNNLLIDLDRDVWLYISQGYLGQALRPGETGSSTMPHKVNPIDFENSEGNLSKANADLVFLADYITTSRLQRDLSDSTVKRNIGSALSHCLIGYRKLADGLSAVTPREAVMRADLEAHPAVLAEAIQTILRREGDADAYERVKAVTRGGEVTREGLMELLSDSPLSAESREALRDLTPAGYTGLASALVDALDRTR